MAGSFKADMISINPVGWILSLNSFKLIMTISFNFIKSELIDVFRLLCLINRNQSVSSDYVKDLT